MEKPWKVVLAFLAVFVAGAVFGGFFTIGFGSRWAALREQHDTGRDTTAPAAASVEPTRGGHRDFHPLQRLPFRWDPKQLMRRYADRLELTPEQRQRLEPLVQRAVEDYRRVQRSTFHETSVIIERLQEDIAKELTPEQRAKLDEMRERQRELLKRFEERREQRKALQREKAQASPPQDAADSSASDSSASPPRRP